MNSLPPPPSYENSIAKDKETKCPSCYKDCHWADTYCSKCGHSLKGIDQANNTVVTLQPGVASTEMTNYINDPSVMIGDRLIYDFEKWGSCICQVEGIDPSVKDHIHPFVRDRGISPSEWRQWIQELDEIQKKAPTDTGCMCLFCCPLGPIQCLICVCCCPTAADCPLSFLPCFYGDWYAALKKWQENVNSRLTMYGMYAKLMTYKPYGNAPRSRRYEQRIAGRMEIEYEMSFLVIALTPEESRKLANESWDHGIKDTSFSGYGRCL